MNSGDREIHFFFFFKLLHGNNGHDLETKTKEKWVDETTLTEIEI